MSEDTKVNLSLAAITLIVFGILFACWTAEGNEQNECVSRGGTVAQIHGGRGGWVCLPPVCSAEGVCVSPRSH